MPTVTDKRREESWIESTVARRLRLRREEMRLTEEQLAWAVGTGEADLVVQINRALAILRENGTLRYILNRWIPVTVEVE